MRVKKQYSITKVILTIELRDDLKEQILNMVFGNSNCNFTKIRNEL